MIRQILKFLVSVVATALIVPFIQTPTAKLAEKIGFDTTLSDRWEGAMTLLSSLSGNPWYIFSAGTVVRVAIGLWVDTWLQRRDEAANAKKNEANPNPPSRPALGDLTMAEPQSLYVHLD
jgi:hypothetical protein